MSPLRCIAVDDNALFLFQLKTFIQATDWLELVGTSSNPVQAATFIIKEQPDVLFLDIEMPHVQGDSLLDWIAPKLTEFNKIPKVVIISANQEKLSDPHPLVSLQLIKGSFTTEDQFEALIKSALLS
ncbi:MAG: chemotaxis response regulator CheB [Cyclobacteriaceae bacterium]|jgi:chemotaxis response regulator CheB